MNTPVFKIGDIIKIFTKDPHDNKVHATPFEGIVISIKGQGQDKTFTIQKNASSHVKVERIFSLASPAIEKINVIKSTRVRRAKLYYLRKK